MLGRYTTGPVRRWRSIPEATGLVADAGRVTARSPWLLRIGRTERGDTRLLRFRGPGTRAAPESDHRDSSATGSIGSTGSTGSTGSGGRADRRPPAHPANGPRHAPWTNRRGGPRRSVRSIRQRRRLGTPGTDPTTGSNEASGRPSGGSHDRTSTWWTHGKIPTNGVSRANGPLRGLDLYSPGAPDRSSQRHRDLPIPRHAPGDG